MQLVDPADVRQADRRATELGVPTDRLMHAAGTAVAEAAAAFATASGSTLVLCGAGDNGGDGYVAAHRLAGGGHRVEVLALDPGASRGESAEAARRLWSSSHNVEALTPDTLADALTRTDLVIDALFGSGLNRPLAGDVTTVVRLLNESGVPVLSVDVPSGIDAGRAVPPGDHVRADHTVQLAWACPASALSPARFAFGTTEVADIGMPDGALDAKERPELIADEAVSRAWPPPSPDAHKYRSGTVLIAAGSERWSGAAELACRGAHRAGAGLVTLLTDAPHPGRWPETIVIALDEEHGSLARALGEADARHQQARVFGPGLDPERLLELVHALENFAVPTVLDASALDPVLRSAAVVHPATWLTPHLGEAARLLAWAPGDVASDPIEAARALAASWRSGVVLKSAGAVIAAPDGRVRVVAAGDVALASGGTGDVLAGVLGAALAAPHDDALERVAAAVLVHARAGEVAARRFGRGSRASDVAEAVPLVLDGLPGRASGAW